MGIDERLSAGSDSDACDHEHCVTCSDEAVAVRVLALSGDGLAMVDAGGVVEEVSIELVDAGVGDTVLVHAGVAIGKLLQAP